MPWPSSAITSHNTVSREAWLAHTYPKTMASLSQGEIHFDTGRLLVSGSSQKEENMTFDSNSWTDKPVTFQIKIPKLKHPQRLLPTTSSTLRNKERDCMDVSNKQTTPVILMQTFGKSTQ